MKKLLLLLSAISVFSEEPKITCDVVLQLDYALIISQLQYDVKLLKKQVAVRDSLLIIKLNDDVFFSLPTEKE